MIKSLTLALLFNRIFCQHQLLVDSGNESNITDFSYSACLNVQTCYLSNGGTDRWLCGASILNQRILLTAAHCVYGCSIHSSMIVRIGNGDRAQADVEYVQKFKINSEYDEDTCANDIALLKLLAPLKLSSAVGRIGLYLRKNIPYDEMGLVAGWGHVGEAQEILSSKLQHTTQKIILYNRCQNILKYKIPQGTICGAGSANQNYVVGGDSGSALVVRNYIQAGLVSFKPPLSSIVVYTDVGYFYFWIMDAALKLYCNNPIPAQ